MDLRDYQQRAVTLCTTAAPGSRALLVAPTGSGKGRIEAALLRAGATVCAPNHDICVGIAKQAGLTSFTRKAMESAGLWTYGRLHNELAAGRASIPHTLILDEGHHTGCDTVQTLIALTHGASIFGLTATPYLASQAATKQLHDSYGHVIHLITIRECVERGYTTLPDCDVWPLVNDELIDVVGGEFVVKQSTARAIEHAPAVAERLLALPSVPTTVVLPSVEACHEFHAAFTRAGLASDVVIANTTNRWEIYERVLRSETILLQVRAVGEGTDLALRRMIDLAPTLSPRLWMQRFGRGTRPGGRSTYIACNHNLMRHAHLLEGLIPAPVLKKAVNVWPDWKPSRRTMSRALGITGFGRFEPTQFSLMDGNSGFLYALKSKTGEQEMAAILIPGDPQPRYFTRTNRVLGTEPKEVKPGVVVDVRVWDRGRWQRVDTLPELKDCASTPAHPLTPNQRAWWEKSAARYGLDPATDDLNARTFTVLPILADAKEIL